MKNISKTTDQLSVTLEIDVSEHEVVAESEVDGIAQAIADTLIDAGISSANVTVKVEGI